MYKDKLDAGIEAVKQAMPLVKKIQQELSGREAITKKDKSPVTIADFSAQGIICKRLSKYNPEIPIVGEEDSSDLQLEENQGIVKQILHYIKDDPEISKEINQENLFESIDLGDGNPDALFWTLDPIDGTKGFLRGEQFVIALALIENGVVQVGILGCPNLHFEGQRNDHGYILSAIKGEGAVLHNLTDGSQRPIAVSKKKNPSEMRFIESYESSHGNMDLQRKIAIELGIGTPSLQMDSQVKYGLVASGEAEIYLRIPNPKSPDYKEKIWDHAAGSLIVEEAGGVVSDIYGKSLDFGCGKRLENNSGIIATTGLVRERLMTALSSLQK